MRDLHGGLAGGRLPAPQGPRPGEHRLLHRWQAGTLDQGLQRTKQEWFIAGTEPGSKGAVDQPGLLYDKRCGTYVVDLTNADGKDAPDCWKAAVRRLHARPQAGRRARGAVRQRLLRRAHTQARCHARSQCHARSECHTDAQAGQDRQAGQADADADQAAAQDPKPTPKPTKKPPKQNSQPAADDPGGRAAAWPSRCGGPHRGDAQPPVQHQPSTCRRRRSALQRASAVRCAPGSPIAGPPIS